MSAASRDRDPVRPAIPEPAGVIGTGAMGMGVLRSLLRAGAATHARDIRPDALAEAARYGATCHATPASLAAVCPVVILLVVDTPQIEDVLFGPDGAATTLRPDSLVLVASTIAPADVDAIAARVAPTGAQVVGAPVSGGPARAADGSMTIMVSGAAHALARLAPMLAAIAGNVFAVGAAPADAAKFKVINNLLAAVNLAAGAEAMALAARAGLDPAMVLDVVNASSGASWIVADRLPRALAGDYAPRAATRLLAKDVGLAVDFARQHRFGAPFACAAHAAFKGAVEAGLAGEDDAVLYRWYRDAIASGD